MLEVIGDAVDLVVSIERSDRGRRVREVIHVGGFYGSIYQTEHCAQLDEHTYAA